MKFNKVVPSILLLTSTSSQTNAFNVYSTTSTTISSPLSLSSLNTINTNVNTIVNRQRHSSLKLSNQNDNDSNNNGKNNLPQIIRNTCISFALSCSVFFTPSLDITNTNSINSINSINLHLNPPTAKAADYNSFTEEQKLLAEAWRIVDNNFIDRTFNNQDWFALRQSVVVKQKYKSIPEARDAIDKMVATLGDKYTRYLTPAKYRSIVDAATGTLAGVGVEISTDKDTGKIYASDVEPSSPALNGGIRKGDIFVQVDGTQMDDGKATPDDVASKLRGPKGSRVGVVMERNGQPQDFILTREPIVITSVRPYISSTTIGPNNEKIGVIRIKSFSGTTAATVQSAIEDLKKQGAIDFILDVRNNPGGLLPGGTDTAGLFLESNKSLVYVVDKKGIVDAQSTFQDGMAIDTPLALLVNGNTASAAEVMTAALKDNGRATVVGEQTFGKGIIQTIRQLSNDNGGIAVTVARYETPLHNNINKQGIPVDVKVVCTSEDAGTCVPASAFKKL